jgi:hypothetical protein
LLVLGIKTASPADAFVLSGGLTTAGYATSLNGDRIEVTFGARDHERMIVDLLGAIEDCLTQHTIETVKLNLNGNRYIVRARREGGYAAS